jgi:uncharacterized protein YxeA
MKKILFFAGALLIVGGAVTTWYSMKSNNEPSLLALNVEALAQTEDNREDGYALLVDYGSSCTITYNGQETKGLYATCASGGNMQSCASGCLTSADLH